MALHRDEQVERGKSIEMETNRWRGKGAIFEFQQGLLRLTWPRYQWKFIDQPSILPGLDRNSIWSHLILAAQQLINESDPSFNSTVMQSSRSFSER